METKEELLYENLSLRLEEGERKLPIAPAILLQIYDEIKNSREGYEKDSEVICDALNLLIKNTSEIPANLKLTAETLEKLKLQLEKKDEEIKLAQKNKEETEEKLNEKSKENAFLKKIMRLLILGATAILSAMLYIIYSAR